MKKGIITLAAAVIVFASCSNPNSSTIAEQDPGYANSFKNAHKEAEEHFVKPPADGTKSEDQVVDTVRSGAHAADTTQQH
ncbi:hypothetical protein [Aridibaculum aurantiacum]|uniref:hypothetical protein n=1 Tax=Aridibaculum aurantiacum TaxID=2810307 RepID=UPI001A963FF9|nr:hypothetical protein [Aridibaculum aurantiacum]